MIPEGAPDLDSDAEPKTAQCVAKRLPMSPYKLNLVAKMVRGMTVQQALDQLEASPKRAAVPVYKVRVTCSVLTSPLLTVQGEVGSAFLAHPAFRIQVQFCFGVIPTLSASAVVSRCGASDHPPE
jgi:ribosomal protein L22